MHEHMHTPSITPLFMRCGQSLADGTGQHGCYTVMVVSSTYNSHPNPGFEFASDTERRSVSRELCTYVTCGVHTAQENQCLVLGWQPSRPSLSGLTPEVSIVGQLSPSVGGSMLMSKPLCSLHVFHII